MLIRFFEISTNTNDGVYRKSDFINPTTNKFWKATDTGSPSTLLSQGSFNFDISDGVTELVIQLTNNSAPMRVTHVVAETEQAGNNNRVVAYVVDSIEYMGNKQIKYLLVEDTFLSHINIVTNTRMLVNRTNDSSHFFEHDTTDLAYTRERTIINSGLLDYTGKWELTTYVMPVQNYTFMKMKFTSVSPSLYEQHSSLMDVRAKYPEVTTDYPLTVAYYGYIVNVANTAYQAQYNFSSRKITWTAMPMTKTYMGAGVYQEVTFQRNVSTEGFVHNVKLISGDLMSFNLCLPVLDNVKARSVITWNGEGTPTFGYVDLPSVSRFNGLEFMTSGGGAQWVDVSSYIVAKRVVTGLTFGDDGSFRPSTPDSSVVYLNNKSLVIVPQREGGTLATLPCYGHVPMLTNASVTHKVKLTVNSLFDHEPFKNYYLSVYGQLIPIKAKLKDQWIYIKSSLSALSWVYTVYVDSINNTIMSGRISAEVPYAIDKYDEFLSQNSTYNTSKWVNTVLGGGTRVATGFLSGMMSGNAGIGAISGAVSIGQDLLNYSLQEKAMKDAPDTIKGNGVDYSTVDIMPYGIYLYSMVPTNDSLELMETEYYAKGHPTNIITTINNLDNEANGIYGDCKFVAGRMVDMVYNYSITSRITDRLKNGVFMLENRKVPMPDIQNVSWNPSTNMLVFDVHNTYAKPVTFEVKVNGVIKGSTLVDKNDYYTFGYYFATTPVSVVIYAKARVDGIEDSDTEVYEYVI